MSAPTSSLARHRATPVGTSGGRGDERCCSSASSNSKMRDTDPWSPSSANSRGARCRRQTSKQVRMTTMRRRTKTRARARPRRTAQGPCFLPDGNGSLPCSCLGC